MSDAQLGSRYDRWGALDEQFAKVAVEKATGATLTHHDSEGRQEAVDYLMRYADGRVGALEITSVSDDRQRALYAQLERINFSLPSARIRRTRT